MDSPLISIITPVLDGVDYIQHAWDSVRAQSWQHWEWLVIDNGSEDESLTLLYELAASDSRIKVFQQQIPGAGQARNIGLDAASGQFICFLDIDDQLPVTSLASRVELLLNQPEVDVVDGGVEIRSADLKELYRTWHPDFKGDPFSELLQLNPACFEGPTWMIRSEVIDEKRFSGYLSHCEDLHFFISLGHVRYSFVDDIVLWYRTGNDSLMDDMAGLEEGYRKLSRWLNGHDGVTSDQSNLFRKKARSIVFKSWLKRGKPVKALRSFLRSW